MCTDEDRLCDPGEKIRHAIHVNSRAVSTLFSAVSIKALFALSGCEEHA